MANLVPGLPIGCSYLPATAPYGQAIYKRRARVRRETLGWFRDPTAGLISLQDCCYVLRLDVRRVQQAAWRIACLPPQLTINTEARMSLRLWQLPKWNPAGMLSARLLLSAIT